MMVLPIFFLIASRCGGLTVVHVCHDVHRGRGVRGRVQLEVRVDDVRAETLLQVLGHEPSLGPSRSRPVGEEAEHNLVALF